VTDNYFTDNADLQFRLDHLGLAEVVERLENGYQYQHEYAGAPRSYADAVDNHRLVLTLLGAIAGELVAPRAAEADEIGPVCADGRVTQCSAVESAMSLLRQAEFAGVTLPWEHGGLNLPESILQMTVEIMSRADASLMGVYGLQEIAAIIISEFGDEEMKGRILPGLINGNLKGGAMVLTEPDAGSDLGSVQTRAIVDEQTGEWRISGVKRFITNGCADVLLVLARSEAGSRDARGLSLFEVTADESVYIRRLEHKLGLRASATCEIQFRETPARLIGKRRFGLIRYAMAMMNGARLAVAAQALGIAEAAYRQAYDYAQKRVQFGGTIGQIPAVYRMLLSMRGEIESTRALLYETARWVDLSKAYTRVKDRGALDTEGRKRLKQANRLSDVLTPLVKYTASEMSNRICYKAVQVHGGVGYMREFAVERLSRDARVTSIYEGTSQLQIVAATGGLLGHALDDLLASWSTDDYGPDLMDLKERVDEATALFSRSIDHLKEVESREIIDYYAADLADLAVAVVTDWLVLRDARQSPRKRDLARILVAEQAPKIRGLVEALRAIDPAPVEVKDVVLGV
jgi:alkylation response protein AidB-like acyl-CoA dehydrogenase